MAQGVKVLSFKSDNVSVITRTLVMEREATPKKQSSSDLYTQVHTQCAHTHFPLPPGYGENLCTSMHSSNEQEQRESK